MSTFEDFISGVKNAIPGLADTYLKGFAAEGSQIMVEYLGTMKANLQIYSLRLAAGRLTQDEYRSLVSGDLEVGKMKLLEIKGLAEAAVDQFLEALTDTLVGSALKILV